MLFLSEEKMRAFIEWREKYLLEKNKMILIQP